MSRLGTLWRTVRHLRPVQVLGRARLHLWHHPRVDNRPAPPLRAATGPWVAAARREPSQLAPDRFRFLSVELALADVGWDDAAVARLWRYNLHYFDDLNAQGAAGRTDWHRALVQRWLTDNPPSSGTGWEPYPVSLRIVNWIKWFMAGAAPEPAWLHSLAVQVRWLAQHLEWHLLGNHLFANAKALVFAGLYFGGDEAEQWLQTGLRILNREIPEQILSDGGHFERSPMYHALALEDLLDLLNLTQARADANAPWRALQTTLRDNAARMRHWLHCMSHPDGSLGLFNDAAQGIAPDNAELDAYAARLGIVGWAIAEGVLDLQPSGYVRVTRGPVCALLDCAPIGPDYLVGHAHADTLAFELSLQGQRMIVNGGTSCYGLDAQRLHERGTAWHSTVQVAEQNSSEVWSGFRVGRRARVLKRQMMDWSVSAVHDGYRYLQGAPQVQRTWGFRADALVVDDAVSTDRWPAVARFHLAPGLFLVPGPDNNQWQVCDGARVLACVTVEAGLGGLEASEYAPRFGVRLPTQTLTVVLQGCQARTRWQWNTDAHPVSH